jgi:hypothetical protein
VLKTEDLTLLSSVSRNTASASLCLSWSRSTAPSFPAVPSVLLWLGHAHGRRLQGYPGKRVPLRRNSLPASKRWLECSAQIGAAHPRLVGVAAAPKRLPPARAASGPCSPACTSGTRTSPTTLSSVQFSSGRSPVQARSLVLGIRNLARHLRAPRLFPVSAAALNGQRRAVVVQADAARHRCLARQCVPAPLPVLDLACFPAVERLLAAPTPLLVLGAVRSPRELLPAHGARPFCAPLLSAGGIVGMCSVGRGGGDRACRASRLHRQAR